MPHLYNLPNSTGGADTILVDTVNVVPIYIPMLLVFTFFVVFLGGIARQKGRSGFADYPMWSIIASISTLIIALILTLQAGLIDILSLTIVVLVNIGSALWFFLERRSGEI